MTSILYGSPPLELHQRSRDEIQTSPLVPGSQALEGLDPASVDEAVVLAPPGAVERRYTLALVLRALKPGAGLIAMAPKDRGGSRLKKELEAFGCAVDNCLAHDRTRSRSSENWISVNTSTMTSSTTASEAA